jgi:hypothetical protein
MLDTNNCLQELNRKPNKPQRGQPISRSRFENLTLKKLWEVHNEIPGKPYENSNFNIISLGNVRSNKKKLTTEKNT